MFQGRGNAIVAVVLLCLVVMVLHCEVAQAQAQAQAQAATYTVGDSGGWTFNTVGWPKGKRFTAGDTLVFNYNSGIHNVVGVNKGGYDNCSTPKGARKYQTGKDQIKLIKGQNFFICNIPGHCESGMKISVNAA